MIWRTMRKRERLLLVKELESGALGIILYFLGICISDENITFKGLWYILGFEIFFEKPFSITTRSPGHLILVVPYRLDEGNQRVSTAFFKVE